MVAIGVLAVRLQDLKRPLLWDGENMRFTNISDSDKKKIVTVNQFKVIDGDPKFDRQFADFNAKQISEGWIKQSNILILALLLSVNTSAKQDKAERAGWLLGVQSYTFHKFSFQEAIDKVQQLGLKYVEVYFGQTLGKDLEGTMDFRMDKATQKNVLDYAKSKGIKIIAKGITITN